jgi:uncharacterized paraquat-inducible protein A
MLEVIGVIAVGVGIFFWEGRPLYHHKQKKELALLASLLLLAVALYIVALKLPVPSTAELLGKLLEPIVNPIVYWIKGGGSA